MSWCCVDKACTCSCKIALIKYKTALTMTNYTVVQAGAPVLGGGYSRACSCNGCALRLQASIASGLQYALPPAIGWAHAWPCHVTQQVTHSILQTQGTRVIAPVPSIGTSYMSKSTASCTHKGPAVIALVPSTGMTCMSKSDIVQL